MFEKTNFVLETPFQFERTVKMLDRIQEEGYFMSLYQLFVKDAGQSASRVEARLKTGGLFIDPEEIRNNFNANLKNVAIKYCQFDESTFIDNADDSKMKCMAEFRKKELILYRSASHFYMQKLFRCSTANGKTYAKTNKIIQVNKDYLNLFPHKHKTERRLKF